MSIQVETPPRKDWRWVTLADVAKVVTGNTPPTADAQNYGAAIPFVKPTELVDRGIRFAPAGLANQALGKARVVPAGAVLVSCIGNLGKTGLAKVPVAFNQQINAVVFNENVVPEFGFYYAQTLKTWLYGESSATTLPIVNKGKFQQAPFPLAPIYQQRQIVAEIEKQFSRLDEAVANLQRVKANLKRYKASVLKDAVEGRLVPTEAELARREGRNFETGEQLLQRILEARRKEWKGRRRYKEPSEQDTTDLFVLPDGWSAVSVEQITGLVEYGSSAKTGEDSTGIPVLRMGNIVNGNFVFDNLKYLPTDHGEFPKLFVEPGDLLFNRTNSPELVGKTAVFKGAEHPFSYASYLIRVRLVEGYAPDFLAAFINSPYGREWVKKVVTQQVGQANVNGTKLQALVVPLPPTDEQCRIVAELDRRMSLIRGVEAEVDVNLKRSQALRQATLATAFSSKLQR